MPTPLPLLPLISLLISTLAFTISAIAIWKTHFASFRPITTVGDLTVRCFPVKYDDEGWYVVTFGVPFWILNAGAQPGVIEESRLVLHFPGVPIPGNYERVAANCEIDPAKAEQIDNPQLQFDELVVGRPAPFPILPKATVMRHILYQTRWDVPVVQEGVVAELQLRINKKWRVIATWDNLHFDADFVWPQLIYGASFTFSPVGQVRQESSCNPADLHRYISSRDHDYSELLRERCEREQGRDAQKSKPDTSSPDA